ncbi:MAG TPA: MotA/TolQ/ExbB proton channel family protein [Planctomycetes bacterium]|nr:MotA/TolQ/ExbB proton channel family protein [Planctomycetota bacterium]
MDTGTRILFVISNTLLEPVVFGLLALLGASLVSAGSFLREALTRGRNIRSGAGHPTGVLDPRVDRLPPPLLARLSEVSGNSAQLDAILSELEVECEARLSRLLLLARLGPMLGLMGTLIPLGPALIGLGRGDLETLSNNLVVAFSTTILGLLVGGIAYTLLHARKIWYARDLVLVELVVDQYSTGEGS